MRKVVCAVLVLMAFWAGTSLGQDNLADFGHRGLASAVNMFSDFNSQGYGARSRAMGDVHLAMYNDGFNSFLNPAMMVLTDKSLMSLDVVHTEDNFNSKVKSGYMYHELLPFDVYTQFGDVEFDGKHSRFDQLGAVAPFTYFDRDWWFGGGYRTVYDLHQAYDLPVYYSFLDRSAGQKFDETRGIDALNAALATQVHPNISVGVNMNLYIRGYRSDFMFPSGYNVIIQDTLILFREHDKSTFSGANFDFASMINIDPVRIGLKISTGYSLSQSIVYTNVQQDFIFGDINNELGYIDRLEATNKMPMSYAGGIAVTPMDKVTIGIDVEHKPFSKVKINVDPEPVVFANIVDYDPEWEDLTQFRFGAEYLLDVGKLTFPLRAGAKNIPSLFKSITHDTIYEGDYLDSLLTDNPDFVPELPVYGDQFNPMVFSFGTGLKLDRIWFDFAYQFGSKDYAQTVNLISGPNPEDVMSLTDPVKLNYSRFYFSMGMLF